MREMLTPAARNRRVVQCCAAEFGFTEADLKGRSRLAPVVEVRREAMRRLLQLGLFPSAIGRLLLRSETTVRHLLRMTAASRQQLEDASSRAQRALFRLNEAQAYFLGALARGGGRRVRVPLRPKFMSADVTARTRCRERGFAATVRRGSPYWKITAAGRKALARHGGGA